ncbi:MAG: 3-deoxy-8-phosphooctulonate synthase [Bacteroidales bacterium]|jgi:2-dehydro-3-deoxyphosphooctonate aldolase (KDO 8-P synthase)|nr:3-deoxy-8-phosphooctulonate synthase [Bacteroidales bacterium]HHV04580.1 3-deoxy-8-phosphooctulonate synthase [Bacteroidales bacterium]
MELNGFFLISGPCVIESEKLCMEIAERLCSLTAKYDLPLIFKSSYRKENRTRVDSFTGIGDRNGLEILQTIKQYYGIRVTTDVHTPNEALMAAEYGIDIIQIPAFLCRQTSLLKAAAQTGKMVNVKKGQFLAPDQMRFVVEKLLQFGATKDKIILTERGTQFGYSDLIFDVRSIPKMKKLGVPVVLDITHSLQIPNQERGIAGGEPELIGSMAAAGVACGVDGIFVETHPRPQEALSDGSNMLNLSKMEDLIRTIIALRQTYISIHKETNISFK